MSRAMIITVGAQGEQIIYSIQQLKPDYIGLLVTASPECKKTLDEVCNACSLSPPKCRVEYFDDNPDEIVRVIAKFNALYKWLKDEVKVTDEEILVDPTGGRKWMSAGVTMIASFLGLEMVYVNVKYKDGKPDPNTMQIIPLGNAYEQTGFLEEAKADKLFNEYNFAGARDIYEFLSKKLQDPRKVAIKKDIAEAYLNWSQLRFAEALKYMESAITKINQYSMLREHKEKLQKQIEILTILNKNDAPTAQFFHLLKDKIFFEKTALTLVAQVERHEYNQQYDQAIILLYRILELISQFRLAQNNINVNNVSDEIKSQYNDQFRRLTKEIFQAESEIPKKVSLVQSCLLLYILKDELLKNENENFFKDLREQTDTRNLLWLEHGNKHATKDNYISFKKFVLSRILTRLIKNWNNLVDDYKYVKF